MATTGDEIKGKLGKVLGTLSKSSESHDYEAASSGSKRKVTFAADIPDDVPYTPLALLKKSSTPKENQDLNKRIAEVWIRLSQAGHYDHLTQTLDEFGLQGEKMKEFFREEGSFLLWRAISLCNDSTAINFIYSNVPKDVIKETLSSKNYAVFKDFLYGEEGKVNNKGFTCGIKEKLPFLFFIDAEGLQSYIGSKYFETQFSDYIKTSCCDAMAEYKSSQLIRSNIKI